jgi:site-specific DNA-methyltransferase (adenine-specific)
VGLEGVEGHPTVKPLSVITDFALRCPENGTILDPFMGSGTTLRAAKDLQRKAVGIEIEEKYCEIAARNWIHLRDVCEEVEVEVLWLARDHA